MANPESDAIKPNHKQSTGRWGEDQAVDFLEARGVQIISRNYRTTYGEIDIIGKMEGCLIFFEVKTRTTQDFGYPEESINSRKRRHLIQTAEAYTMQNPSDNEWRIDVIAIRRISGKSPEIMWFQNAVVE